MNDKSDLYFINAVRGVLRLSPLHQGAEGSRHHSNKIEEVVSDDVEADEEDELRELMAEL